MRAEFTLESEVGQSPRVMQTASMMDVPTSEKTSQSWCVDVPIEDQDWSVGLVVGPSGSGKSSLASYLWPDELVREYSWSRDAAILDDFPENMSIRDITKLLVSVGLGSVPGWLRPFSTLSTGEAFRATIARALAETEDCVAVDEFTSVVDRHVAQIASHTIQKTVRNTGRQFIAVTCHYDVVDWLQPDWVLDMAGGTFSWRSVQPHPPIELRIHQVDHSAWRVFAPHHYLTGELHKAAWCFGAFNEDGECVGFTSYIHFPHAKAKNIKRLHRTVVLPDWQGVGISGRMTEWLGQYLYDQGWRCHRSIAHPAVIAHCAKSPRWREIGGKQSSVGAGKTAIRSMAKYAKDSRRMAQRSFVYVPPVRSASNADTAGSR